MNGNGFWQAAIPHHETIALVKAYIETAIGAHIKDAVIFGIFPDHVQGFSRKIFTQLFPGGAEIFTDIEVSAEMIITVTIKCNIYPSFLVLRSDHPAYP